MTTAQNDRYLALLNPFANKSVQIVSTGDVRNYQINDTLPFQIPGRAGLIVAVATEVVLNQSSGFSWSAKIINEPGYVSLQYRNNQIFGFIQIENDFYELMPMDDTHQFLVNRLIDSERDCGMPSSSPTSPSPPGPNECSEPPAGFDPYNTCPAIVSVLLVITNEAKIWILENYGSIEAFALEGQSIVNLAFLNSDIPNKEVRVRWIERNYSPFLSINLDINDDRLGLPTVLGFDRSTQLADIAFLITNQGYPDASGAVSDIAVNSGTSYGIIEAPFFNAAYSFPHELGHLMGCHHNWTKNLGDDDTDVIAHAFRHIYLPSVIDYEYVNEVDSWHTLIGRRVGPGGAYLLEDENGNPYPIQVVNDARVLHYSNPDVNYAFLPTGNECANNAAQIRNAACVVSSFFASQELAVFIDHENSPCIPSRQFIALIIEPSGGIQGIPPYSVTWEWSPNGNFGLNTGVFLASGQTITLAQHPACPVYWLKCTITSSDGVIVSSIKKIVMDWSCCPFPDPGGGHGGIGRSMPIRTLLEVNISPNPSGADEVLISINDIKTFESTYILNDVGGTLTRSGSLFFDNGQARLNTQNLSPGLYFLQVRINASDMRTIKFTVIKN